MIAVTDSGLVPMRVSKAVALEDGDHLSAYMVLDELEGDRHLVIGVGDAEAFALDASLQGLRWGRPMTYEFTAALVRSLGGHVREVRLDRIAAGAYAATVEVEGPQGVALVDARSSDALNLAARTQARSSSRRRCWPTASVGRRLIPLRLCCSSAPLPQARWLSAERTDSSASACTPGS
jgi:bifunctional DNase/RNase